VILIFVVFFTARTNITNFEKKYLNFLHKTNNTLDFVFHIQNFLREEISFDELKTKKVELIVNDQKLNNIWNDIEKINSLNIENKNIMDSIENLTENSIEKSNTYIYSVSKRLANTEFRSSVSTIERSVIGGALANTNAAYKLKIGIYKLNKNISYKNKFLPFIETLIIGAKRDIKN